MKVLLFDTETTGIDPTKDRVVEAAGVLWSVDHASSIASFGFVFRSETNEAESINRIPAAMLREHGVTPDEGFARVKAWAERADAIVAHSAHFDRSFLPAAMQDVKPWICSCDDIEWPAPGSASPLDGPARDRPGKSLVALCLEHGVGVSSAHRALTDVMLLARLLERVAEMHPEGGGDTGVPSYVQRMLVRAMRPKRRYVVADKGYSPQRNDQAKTAGFRWSGDPEKVWWKRLVVEDVPKLVAELPFAIREQEAP